MPSLVKTNTVLLQFRILLGVGVVVAHLTLTQVVQVRFLYPLPNKCTFEKVCICLITKGESNEAKE
jgi:hypothetical protein